MDGRKGQLGSSLQFRLSAWLALVIGGVALAAGVFSFSAAFREANELQDDQLRQIAAVVRRQRVPLTQAAGPSDASELDPESLVVLQVLAPPGQLAIAPPGPAVAFPANIADGVQTVSVDRQDWRVVVETLESGTRIVVGQMTSVRDEIARDSALRTLLPIAILIPILLLLVGALIRAMLKPVKDLALDIDQRAQDDLREMSEAGIPTELRPFVVAINRLLSRVAQSMAGQRRFLADAAHELRTPLTALSLQSGLLGAADMSAQARERLGALQGGLERSRQLLDQLLALARAQDGPQQALQQVSVFAVFLQVAEALMPLALAKQIDLGMLGEQDYTVLATEIDLRTLVKNLVDNAIRYTPAGGRVDLSARCAEGRTELLIADTGPGIAEEERARVFDPFYRLLGSGEMGSGLGLSIVQSIAQRIGAHINLEHVNTSEKTGLRVVVSFLQVAQ